MPIIGPIRTTMTANGTATPLSGSQYEYLPFDALVEIAIQASAVNQVLATVYSGMDVLMEESAVQFGTSGAVPKYPDDFYLVDEALAGERLNIKLREIAGATPVVITVVRLTPI